MIYLVTHDYGKDARSYTMRVASLHITGGPGRYQPHESDAFQ